MGYLVDTSQTLSYSEVKSIADYIKEHGIIQFLHLYKKFKDTINTEIRWGDEIELHLLNIDPQTKVPRLQLNTDYLFQNLTSDLFSLQPEYGAWMLETVPLKAYDTNGDPNIPLQNFKARRDTIRSFCKQGDVLFAGTVYPLLKVGDYFIPKNRDETEDTGKMPEPEEEKNSPHLQPMRSFSSQYRDELLNPHPRYSTLCDNIRNRRGEKVCIRIPIYKDEKTSMEKTSEEPYPGFIYMDETIFGTGSTSMQITFGTRNIDEARYLADQLAPFSSIVLPLSAGTAIFKGKLTDVDVRWNALGESVDCRTLEERDPTNSKYLAKSRWAGISRYISNRPQCKEAYNDVACPLDSKIMKFAKDKAKELGIEIDDRLVSHLGFLFFQDPLVVFSDKVFVDDEKNTNHFENIQSTNWNNIRFKPPPSFESNIGWRVELRTMECQLTPDESVALAMFSFFVGTMIMKKHYNFYIPISKVDENINRAHERDAVVNQKFWFRKNVEQDSLDEWVELTINEILHGKEDTFVGLFNLIYEFCKEEYGIDMLKEWARKKENPEIEINPVAENMKYFEILTKRSTGKRPTTAKWIRTFVLNHPKYEKNSIVSPEIAADLVAAMTAISDGEKSYEDFL